ncbi:hypothetical protein BDZ45DRAFT_249449 [Acephala macrosclerotiorum]|nr:hypothetical protein BDZ45DRAFT_249449 [Acephala macrosclerotiorum]
MALNPMPIDFPAREYQISVSRRKYYEHRAPLLVTAAGSVGTGDLHSAGVTVTTNANTLSNATQVSLYGTIQKSESWNLREIMTSS